MFSRLGQFDPTEPTMIDPYTGEVVSALQTDPYTGRIVDMRTGQIVYDPQNPNNEGLWLDTTGEVTATPPGPLVIEVTGGETGTTESQIDELRRKMAELWDALAVVEPMRSRAISVGMGAEFDSTISWAKLVPDALDSVANAVRDAWGWAKSTFGLAGLGALPLLPIAAAVVIGLIAFFGERVVAVWDLKTRIEARERGIPVPLPGPPPTFPEAISNTAMWLALGAAAVAAMFLLQKQRGQP